MNKISKFVKNNLLGLAVAIGVCCFLYEGLIESSPDFPLTKISGLGVFIIATYSKYKDNLAVQAKKNQKSPEKTN